MGKQKVKVIADQLLEKIERLELAAQRGIKISEDPYLQHCSGKMISPEQCHWTLKDCALFKKWVNECFESFELTAIEVLPQEKLAHDEFSTPTEEMITIDKALFKQLLHLALNNPNFTSQIADVDVNCSAAPAGEIFMHLKPSDFLLRLEATLRTLG